MKSTFELATEAYQEILELDARGRLQPGDWLSIVTMKMNEAAQYHGTQKKVENPAPAVSPSSLPPSPLKNPPPLKSPGLERRQAIEEAADVAERKGAKATATAIRALLAEPGQKGE